MTTRRGSRSWRQRSRGPACQARELSLDELAALPDEEIDSIDIPELGDEFFRNAKLVMPAGKRQVTLRIDAEVLDRFRAKGKDYQTRMNAVLRTYVAAHR
jgi:uncharacterized protein (DUF4415 family)